MTSTDERCGIHPRYYRTLFGGCPYCEGRLDPTKASACTRCLSHPVADGDVDGYCEGCRIGAEAKRRRLEVVS